MAERVEEAAPPGSGESVPDPPARRRLRDSAAGNVLVIVIATAVILGGVWVVNSLTRDTSDPAPSASASTNVSDVTLTGDTSGQAPKVGQAAPDFTSLSISGDEVSLATLKGKPVWLVFGATWCANCRAEAPDVQSVSDKYRSKASVVQVYVGESISTVSSYADRLALTFPQIADSYTDVGSRYRVMGLPTHVFIDSGGVIRSIRLGAITESEAAAQLDAMLAG